MNEKPTQEVIQELSLEACADSLVGTELVRGISGALYFFEIDVCMDVN